MLGYGSLWLVQKQPRCLLPDLTSPPPLGYEYEWEMSNFSFPFQQTATLQNHKQQEEDNDKDEADEHTETATTSEWDFTLSTVVSTSAATGSFSNTLGVIEFDPTETLLATGGIARKITIYSVNSLLPAHGDDVVLLDHAAACDYYMCTPAKLSSLRWRPGSNSRLLGSGDYDGVVTEYDLETRLPIFERDEHGGRRVWSVDYSHSDPGLGASGSDDGTLQMWDPRCEGGDSVAKVHPSEARNPVCCVEFNPFGGSLLAVGCADRKAYAYDVRRMAGPVLTFDGHGKTVTYVRFLDGRTMVSAALSGYPFGETAGYSGAGRKIIRCLCTIRGGANPFGCMRFEPMGSQGSDDRGFVSSVCWRQMGSEDHCTLVAGGSDGVLQVFEGRRKSLMSN
ncbi:hypothetical protein M0R45_038026 [Rubus argutus]|uniref:Uncharacterized protein n=1 Tax=Rubus argutus TaxID=59490 RepID=A0AAW1W268_RUBAR